jgi:hypothetical protein
MKVVIFRIVWAFDAFVAAVFAYFFVKGLSVGTVSSFNLGLWLGILGGFAAVLAGGWFAHYKGRTWLALVLLALPAVPALLYLLFIAFLIVLQPDWR